MKLLIVFILCLTSLVCFAKPRQGTIIASESIATDTTTIISDVIDLGSYERFSLASHLDTGSTATGTISIYLSDDLVTFPSDVVNWIAYGTDKTFTTVTHDLLSNITDVATKWVKVNYTKEIGVGTGTLSTIIYIPE